ncbi:unnamed protein product [Thelazia callipaeda]|uniref:Transmembrane protein n=1 Tax=Thelazia callipaeda TaxID=103827 RepID=A0A0N5D8E4_THECL|nr:unnamed protein product [Thelazia callipaeda]
MYPPVEFQRAGFTIQALFSKYLGREKDDFIGYHLRRTVLTRFIHLCLPLLYFVYLSVVLQETVFVLKPQTILQLCAHLSIVIAFGFFSDEHYGISVSASVMFRHLCNKFDSHSTVRHLKRYIGNNEISWHGIAESINREYRNTLETLSITLTGIDRVVMTSSWILNITNYSLTCAQVGDVVLEAIKADEHPISHHLESSGSTQFVNICVKSTTECFEPFVIRIRTESFRDLRNKLNRPIAVAREIVLKQSLNECFIEVFTKQIAHNLKYDYDEVQRLEPCLGCCTEISNIKLWKQCLDYAENDVDDQGRPRPQCTQCYCKPMWCDSCMGRIFLSKQDPYHPESWLPGKAQCPTCRATFCVLDVAFLNTAGALND